MSVDKSWEKGTDFSFFTLKRKHLKSLTPLDSCRGSGAVDPVSLSCCVNGTGKGGLHPRQCSSQGTGLGLTGALLRVCFLLPPGHGGGGGSIPPTRVHSLCAEQARQDSWGEGRVREMCENLARCADAGHTRWAADLLLPLLRRLHGAEKEDGPQGSTATVRTGKFR